MALSLLASIFVTFALDLGMMVEFVLKILIKSRPLSAVARRCAALPSLGRCGQKAGRSNLIQRLAQTWGRDHDVDLLRVAAAAGAPGSPVARRRYWAGGPSSPKACGGFIRSAARPGSEARRRKN